MQKNFLKSGIEISELGLGCMSLGTDFNKAQPIIESAIENGITYFDTADIYDQGINEEIIGKALKNFADALGVNYSYDDEALLKNADYVFLGTKPHDFEDLADRIRDYITKDNRFISIVAGLSIDYIRQQLNTNTPLARIMPNTNAQVGHSVTRISYSNNFGPKSKDEVNELIHAFGSVIEVSEDHLHQVTAITGSGPAFLYHVFE